MVDEVAREIGEMVTIFQRINEQGDMLRVATTVKDGFGRRAIGTYIPALDPDGLPNPVVAAILKGTTYHGRAFVVTDWYLTAYEPIRNTAGTITGMLYVGVRQANIESRVRQAVLQTKVGKTGYVYVLSGKGEGRGRYIVSNNGERDGEDIWESKDSDDRYVIKSIISKALALRPGEMATERYRWQNPGEDAPRWKIARLAYYEPWDWVIGTSVYEDELLAYRTVLINGRIRMTRIMCLAGLLIALIIGLAGTFTTWTIVSPIRQMTEIVETIIQGDLNRLVDVRTNGEIGKLSHAFNRMTVRLRETLETLRRNEERFRSLIENASDVITLLDGEGIIRYQSASAEQMLGYKTVDLIGHPIFEFIHPDDLPRVRESHAAALRAQHLPQRIDFRFLHRDGTYHTLEAISLNRLADPAVGGIIVNSRDITERKRTEEELRQHREHLEDLVKERTAELTSLANELVRANRIKSEFLANMSHELRTPLNSIIGFSEVLYDETFGPLNARQKKYTDNVLISGRHLLSLINEVLDLSKVEAGKMSLVIADLSLTTLFTECAQLVQMSAAKKKLSLSLAIADDIGSIKADERRLKEVAYNLLSNAIKFTPAGGRIGVTATRQGPEIRIEVWDTGIGIAPENLQQVFQPFTRLAASYNKTAEGTGLGLAMCQRLIELHGGRIWIESPGIDKGTRVIFVLPIAPTAGVRHA